MTPATAPAGRDQTPRLSQTRIVDACIALGDREGLEAMTLRRLGLELGADPTAVYRHFRDKDELLAAVADRLLAGVVDRFRRTGHWRSDLRRLTLAGRRVYMAHPRLAHLLATSPDPLPSNRRIAEIVIGALREAGLDDREAALGFEVLEDYVAGASALDAEIGTDAAETWRARFAALPEDRYPNAVAVATHLYRNDEAAFAFGLDLLLDALERRARAGADAPARTERSSR
jgi:AcrR family transcriptional regulator